MILFFSSIAVMNFGQGGYQVGDIVADFTLKGTDDQNHTFSQIAGSEGAIVIFTCNHCPYSQLYEDRIIALQSDYEGKGLPVVAINPNDPAVQPEDSFENMKIRAEEKGFNFLYLFDDGQKVYPKFGATRTPHVFLVDKNMTIRYIGAIDDSPRDASSVNEAYVRMAADAVIAGKEVNPIESKAIGCSIKTK